MSIELKITVNHATDLVAEVQMLADIFSIKPAKEFYAEREKVVTVPQDATGSVEGSRTNSAYANRTDDKKILPRKEQDEAVKEMIAAGAKDARFDMLTKGRQQEIEKALDKPAETIVTAANSDADLDDMFGDDSAAAPTEVTRQMVSDLMAKVGKDKDGKPIQSKLLKIREILVDLIPENPAVDPKELIKVRNIPEDKLAEAFEKIGKMSD